MAYRDYSVAYGHIVDAGGHGDFTTVQSAVTAASSGQTIFIRPGTYTENVTLKSGVNLTAFGTDNSFNTTGVVIIAGTCTLTTAGSVTISGIQLQTNSAALLAVTGSAASIVNLFDCFLNCSNTTGITSSSSNAAAAINIYYCGMDLGTTGIAYFSDSSAGSISIEYCDFLNSGGSSTANTKSAGQLSIKFSTLRLPITYSSSNAISAFNQCVFNTAASNSIFLTTSGTGVVTINQSNINSGSASSISIGSGTTCNVNFTSFNSSNTNVLTGAGILGYTAIGFVGSSNGINVTTQNPGQIRGGYNAAASSGSLGEQIRSAIASGSATALTTATAKNVTSISLTAGTWNVCGIVNFTGTPTVSGAQLASVNSSSATIGTQGDNAVSAVFLASAFTVGDISLTIPSWVFITTSTVNVYLVAQATFSAGSCSAYGRISATRIS